MSSHSFKIFGSSLSLVALLGASTRLGAQELTESTRLTPMWSTPWFGDYDRHIQRYLIKDPGAQLWLIISPGFSSARALELDCKWAKDDEPKPTAFTLRSTETEAPTWTWAVPPPPGAKNLFPARIKTTSHSTPIPPDAAQAFINAWVHMLRETRYPKNSEFVFKVDGTTFEFFGWWDRGHNSMPLMGLTISPEAGPTRMLTDLGEHLIDYTKASEKDRPALLANCVEEAKAIQAYEYK
jgi:hypothetical protein